MKHLKKFEAFQDTEFNKFCGIDISDIYSIKFSWSDKPHLSGDYNDKFGNYKDPDKKMSILDIVREKLSTIGKNSFYKILVDEGLNPDVEPNGFSINLQDNDLVTFFHIIENIEEFKR